MINGYLQFYYLPTYLSMYECAYPISIRNYHLYHHLVLEFCCIASPFINTLSVTLPYFKPDPHLASQMGVQCSSTRSAFLSLHKGVALPSPPPTPFKFLCISLLSWFFYLYVSVSLSFSLSLSLYLSPSLFLPICSSQSLPSLFHSFFLSLPFSFFITFSSPLSLFLSISRLSPPLSPPLSLSFYLSLSISPHLSSHLFLSFSLAISPLPLSKTE